MKRKSNGVTADRCPNVTEFTGLCPFLSVFFIVRIIVGIELTSNFFDAAGADNLETVVDAAASEFASRFSRPPQWIAAAPGRVNVIGEHVDYNDGIVLPMAIDRYTIVATLAVVR